MLLAFKPKIYNLAEILFQAIQLELPLIRPSNKHDAKFDLDSSNSMDGRVECIFLYFRRIFTYFHPGISSIKTGNCCKSRRSVWSDMLSDRVFCTDNCEALDRMPRQHRSVYKKIPPLAEALPRNQTTIIHHSNVHVSENLKVDKRKNPAVFANVVKSYKRISTCDCRSFYTLHLWSSIQKRLSKCIQRISERVCVHIHICNYWWCRADLHVCMTGRGQRMKQQILWGMTDLRLGF